MLLAKRQLDKFKTGDQIYIQGASLISQGIEAATNSPYSHVVMVIRYERGGVFFTNKDGEQEMLGGPKNNLFVFQASGPVGQCISVYDQKPGVEGVQLNPLMGSDGYLENYGDGKMWIRKLSEELTVEEESAVYKFVEDSCKKKIPYQQDPERLFGACWFSVTKLSWFSP